MVDKILRPLKGITEGSSATSKALRAVKDQLKQLNREQENISAFRKLSKDVSITTNQLSAAQAEVKRIKEVIASVAAPTKDMARALKEAQKEAHNLKMRSNELAERTQRMRDVLKSSGIETSNMSSKQRELKAQIENATGAVQRETAALEHQNKRMQAIHAARANRDKMLSNRNQIAGAGANALVGSAALGMPILKTIKEYASAEDAATQLKVAMMGVGGKVAPEFEAINKQARELGDKLPGTTADYQNMMTMLIRQGMSAKAVLGGLGKATAYLGVQLKIPMDAAAEFASKLQDATRTTEGDMMGLMDVIQRTFYLGVDSNNMLDAFAKLSPAMSIIKKQGLDAAGVFAPLIVMADQAGMRGEAAGNAWRKVFQSSLDVKRLSKANEALQGTGINLDFSNGKGEFGGMDKLFANMDKLKKLTTQKRISVIKELFGDDAETLQAVSLMIDKGKSGYEEVQAKMAAQADIQRRVNEQLGTLKSLWDAASGTFTNALVSFGETISPEVKSLTQWIGDMSAKLSAFAQEHPVLVGAVMKSVAVLAILLAGLGLLGIVIASVLGPLALFKFGIAMLPTAGLAAIGVMRGIVGVLQAVRLACLANPFGALLLAATAIIIYWEPVKNFFIGLWDSIGNGIKWAMEKLEYLKPLLNLFPGIKLAMAAATVVTGTGAAQSEPIRFNNKPPITAQRAAAQMPPGSTISIAVHATPGMNEQQLAQLVAREMERLQRQQATRKRSSLTDSE